MNLMGLNIVFCVKTSREYSCLQEEFEASVNVGVVRADIIKMNNIDCVIMPSNSYGLIQDEYGKMVNFSLNNIMNDIQNTITEFYYGEQPIGTSIIRQTNSDKFKYIAHTPIFRVPTDVSESENAYVSFRAALTAILNHNKYNEDKITSIVCPCLCTDTGSMTPDRAAKQMRHAWNFVDLNLPASRQTADMINQFLEDD